MASSQTVWFVRHGQSYGNISTSDDPPAWDASLTPRGEKQARKASERIKDIDGIELIVMSPLRRTIQTAKLATAGRLYDKTPKIVVAENREYVCGPDDIGSPPRQLAKAFPELDFRHLDEVWWYSGGDEITDLAASRAQYQKEPFEEPYELFYPRLREFREWLRSRPERVILVFSHNIVINTLTGIDADNCEIVRTELAPSGKFVPVLDQTLSVRHRIVHIQRRGHKGKVHVAARYGDSTADARAVKTQAAVNAAWKDLSREHKTLRRARLRWLRRGKSFEVVPRGRSGSSSSSSAASARSGVSYSSASSSVGLLSSPFYDVSP